jgi:hypothetical protein
MNRRLLAELTWQGYHLPLAMPDARWFDWLERFTGLPAQAMPDGRAPTPILEVVDPLHALVDGADLRRFSTPDELKVWLFLTVSDVMVYRSDATVLHAAGFLVGDHAVLAAGPPFAGKSSWALQARASGLPVLGDDQVRLDLASGRVCGLPRPLKRRLREPKDWLTLDAEAVAAPLEDEQVALVPLGADALPLLVQTYPVGMIVHLARHSGPGVHWRQLDGFAAKHQLLDQIRCYAANFLPAVTRAVQRLAQAPNLHLSIGDGQTALAMETVLDLLDTGQGSEPGSKPVSSHPR